jgi:hypothetical protein
MTPGRRISAELLPVDQTATEDAEPLATRVRANRAPLNAKFATERVVATPAASRILDAIPGRNAE